MYPDKGVPFNLECDKRYFCYFCKLSSAGIQTIWKTSKFVWYSFQKCPFFVCL